MDLVAGVDEFLNTGRQSRFVRKRGQQMGRGDFGQLPGREDGSHGTQVRLAKG